MKHLELRQSAYGLALWLPKSHYVLHIGCMLWRFGRLLSTFTEGRKHKTVMRLGTARANTTSMDKGQIEDITLQQLHDHALSYIFGIVW